MTRRHLAFDVGGDRCAATLDEAAGTTGLLIISGGNEIRSGAHGGQAAMAHYIARLGFPVLRYDRRGIGDSEGDNRGFEGAADDIAAAIRLFHQAVPTMNRLVAFGNCDAASALALFPSTGAAIPFDALLLANPWVIEVGDKIAAEAATMPTAAAIRARYWTRIKNPRSLIELFTGKIDMRKLLSGLAKAAMGEPVSGLALRLGKALGQCDIPVQIWLAAQDNTALAFDAAWRSAAFDAARARSNITLSTINSGSHSFADSAAKSWLLAQVAAALAA